MSEEANAAAGLVAELERLRTDNAELRASAELTQRQWQDLVAANAGQRRLLDLAQAEIAEARNHEPPGPCVNRQANTRRCYHMSDETYNDRRRVARPGRVVVWLDHDLAGNGSRYHYAELIALWRAKNPAAQHVPEPRGPRIANDLLAAGVRASVYEWPRGTPLKADIGWLLSEEAV